MRIIGFTEFRVVYKALVAESIEILGIGDSVINDEPRHGSPTGLCPNCLDFQVVPFADIEQGLDNTNLLADSLPVEKVLVFLCGKMYQNTVIAFTESMRMSVRRLFQKPNIFFPSPLGSSTAPSIRYGRIPSKGRSIP